jgi:hypothetical protein
LRRNDGREFEKEVAEFFRRADFRVEVNSKTARPRQTDVFAYNDRLKIVVEAKNSRRNVNVGDIEALRCRLNRVPTGFVGAVFTTANLSKTAIDEIKENRSQQIVAFVREEVEALRSGRKNISALLLLKLRALTNNAQVLIGHPASTEYIDTKLPSATIKFHVGGATAEHYESRVDTFGATFALEIPDTGGAWGEGARIAVPTDVQDAESLRDVIGYLHKNFGLSKNGMYCIRQSQCAWQGVGVDAFIRSANGWKKRYADSPSTGFHHSEELIYFDKFEGGWVEVYAQQRVPLLKERQNPFFYHGEIVIQLPGIPLDTSRISELCDYVGCLGANFQCISERLTSRRRLKKAIRLDVVGTVVEALTPPLQDTEERMVVGCPKPIFQEDDVAEGVGRPRGRGASGIVRNRVVIMQFAGSPR